MQELFIKSTDYGMVKYGYNPDVDGAETIWTAGGAFPWASVAANAATTIESSSANDAAAGTGARTVYVEGLVQTTIRGITGGKVTTETVTLNGTTPVTLSNEYSFIYRMYVVTAGTGGVNAGNLIVKHGATVIAHILAGTNNTEMAVMTIPHFTRDGIYIHGAWLLELYAYITSPAVDATANMIWMTGAGALNPISVKFRASLGEFSPIDFTYQIPQYLKSGSIVECAAAAVSATNQMIEAGFSLRYDIGG